MYNKRPLRIKEKIGVRWGVTDGSKVIKRDITATVVMRTMQIELKVFMNMYETHL